MPRFEYKARDRMGGVIAGTMDAPSAQEVGTELSKMGHFPVSIQSAVPDRLQTPVFSFLGPRVSVKQQELVLFSRQMATLFNAGIPILAILQALGEQMDNLGFKKVIGQVERDVGDGLALSEAMSRHPKVFSELYVSMIEAGETGGIMDDILVRLADLLERQEENRAKVKAAFRYPKIVVGVMFLAITILMWKVVPVFINLFKTIKIELPLPTRMLIAANDIFVNYWWMIFGGMGLIYYGFECYIKTETGHRQWDYFKLKMPLLGPINLRSSMAKFSRVFGNLQRSGVPILDTIQVASRVVDNRVLAEVIRSLLDSVSEGKGLAQPLKDSGWIPTLVVQMVAAGEGSGALDEMLLKVADYYDEEVDRGIKALSDWLEPILIVFMGVLVLFLALAIFLPMWDMTKMANRGG